MGGAVTDQYVVVSIVKGRQVRVHGHRGLTTAGRAQGLARQIKLNILAASRDLRLDDVQVLARRVSEP